MRGRKPQEIAVRRGGGDALEFSAQPIETSELVKPSDVAAIPVMSETWDAIVGHGYGLEPSDGVFVRQLVSNIVAANQAWAAMTDENGNMRLTVPRGEPDENGNYEDFKPNPYLKIANDATTMALKLADQLGCTRTARSRLGLQQSLSMAASVSIAAQIDKALGAK